MRILRLGPVCFVWNGAYARFAVETDHYALMLGCRGHRMRFCHFR